MICKFCGEELDDDSLFCTECGNMVSDEENVSDIQQEEVPVYSENAATITDASDSVLLNEVSDDSDSAENDVSDEPDLTVSLEEPSGEVTGYGEPDPSSFVDLADEKEDNENQEEFLPDESEEPVIDEPEADEAEADVLSQKVEEETPETVSSADRNSEMVGRLMLAVIFLAGALLALTGYLFADKFYLSRNSTGTQTITIISQPQDVVTKVDAPVIFFVEAKGKNLTYQWYYRKPGDEYWHLWKTHDQARTSANANDSWNGMQVYCVITDNYRHAISTDIATIVVKKDSQKNK